MFRNYSTAILLIITTFIATFGWMTAMAQEDTYILAHDDVFGKLKRPGVNFPHEAHSEKLADVGCGLCHHSKDEEKGSLIYIEGEEQSCGECHAANIKDGATALREAFHGSCTVCHRNIIKKKKRSAGPRTCGGCHKKRNR